MDMGETSKNTNLAAGEFTPRLARLRRRHQAGLLFVAVLRAAGLALVLLFACGLADFFLGLESAAIITLNFLVAGVAGFAAVAGAAQALRFRDRDLATLADQLQGNRRRAHLSAYELARKLPADTESMPAMRAFLTADSIRRAAVELAKLRFRQYFPLPLLARRFLILGAQMALVAGVAALDWTAASTVARRFANPRQDIPPFSRLVFEVEPDTPQVVYGGDVEVAVTISAIPPGAPVWLLTRHDGASHRAACFQEAGGRYAQRLEKVIGEVEFAFTTGRARSRWHRVDLLLRPRIALASATVAPPAYSRLPPRQILIGQDELSVRQFSSVNMSITSNRPLLDGQLTIRPRGGLEADILVPSQTVDGNRVGFEWTADTDAELEINIRDIRGTPMASPLRVVQTIVSDQPPAAFILEPPEFSLATPRVSVPLSGYADDDLELSRVELVKSVLGYRDRFQRLGPEAPERRVDFKRVLDLGKLGVQPGQVLEFYLEAADSNPNMLGTAASTISRVQIISEEEYAGMLMAREKFEDFSARFNLLERQMEKLRQALDELSRAAKEAENSTSDDGDWRRKRDEAIATAAEVAETADKMAKDFLIYEMEAALAAQARGVAGIAAMAADELAAPPEEPKALAAKADALLETLGGRREELRKTQEDVAELEKLYRLMECRHRYSILVQRQEELVKRLGRFEAGTQAADLRLLAALGAQQEQIRGDLEMLLADIRRHAAALDDQHAEIRKSALDFANLADELEISPAMAKAVERAANQDGGGASHHATLALERMRQLLSDCDGGGFGGMAGGGTSFNVPRPGQQTLEQMRRSMIGGGFGGIGAGAGDPDDGYAARSQSPLNTPTFGPDRMSPAGGDGTAGGGDTDSKGTGGAITAKVGQAATIDTGARDTITSGSRQIENVPEKYRRAVINYFSDNEP